MTSLQLQLCDIQGRLFELSGKKGYDSISFIKAFMLSHVAKGLDSKYNRFQWAGEEYLLAEVADWSNLTHTGNIFDKEILYWCGYIYRFWHFYTQESSKDIYKKASAETIKHNWFMFHTLAPEIAIDNLIEIYSQKRKSACYT